MTLDPESVPFFSFSCHSFMYCLGKLFWRVIQDIITFSKITILISNCLSEPLPAQTQIIGLFFFSCFFLISFTLLCPDVNPGSAWECWCEFVLLFFITVGTFILNIIHQIILDQKLQINTTLTCPDMNYEKCLTQICLQKNFLLNRFQQLYSDYYLRCLKVVVHIFPGCRGFAVDTLNP